MQIFLIVQYDAARHTVVILVYLFQVRGSSSFQRLHLLRRLDFFLVEQLLSFRLQLVLTADAPTLLTFPQRLVHEVKLLVVDGARARQHWLVFCLVRFEVAVERVRQLFVVGEAGALKVIGAHNKSLRQFNRHFLLFFEDEVVVL